MVSLIKDILNTWFCFGFVKRRVLTSYNVLSIFFLISKTARAVQVSHKPFLSARASFLWLLLAPSSIFQLPSENVGIRTVLHVPAPG